MPKITRRAFAASSAAARPYRFWFQAGLGASLSGAAGDRDRAVGRGRRHRRDRAHRRGAAGEGPRPALQRGQPHRRLRRGRPYGDRHRTARRLHHRHADGGNLDDALAGAHRTGAEELHAARADERRPARHPGQSHIALQDREGTRRRHQGSACRQVQGLGHRPGRHLASRAGRLDAGDGTSRQPGAWVPSNGAAPAMQDLAAGGLDLTTCSVPEARAIIEAGKARSLAIMAPARNPAFPNVPTLKEAMGIDYATGAWRGIAGPKGLPADVADQAHRVAEEGLRLQGVQGIS